MAKKRIPKTKRKNLIKGKSDNEEVKMLVVNSQNLSDDFLISFKYLDRGQGQTLDEWESQGLLARAIDTLRNYCSGALKSQMDGKKFTVYGNFPSRDKTDYRHPKHVPQDAEWARIHVTGTQILAGYVNRNVFNVVFLDKDHKFYKSSKKHT